MNTNTTSFSGLGVALVTPMNSDGSIDYTSLKNLVDHTINEGVDYLVVLGTTGETSMLSRSEQDLITGTIVEQCNGRVPLVLGSLAGNNTKEVVQAIKTYDLSPYAGLLIASPSYVKPSQEGIVAHYKAIADVTDLPIILYNVPGRTSSNMSWQTVAILAHDCPNIVAIKEASGDISQAMNIMIHCPDDFMVLSGDDPTCLALITCGAKGVISVIGNVYTREFSQMVHAALREDITQAQQINKALFPLHHWLYVEGNPVGIKSAAQIKGMMLNEVRLPMVKLSDTNYEGLKKEMEKL